LSSFDQCLSWAEREATPEMVEYLRVMRSFAETKKNQSYMQKKVTEYFPDDTMICYLFWSKLV